MKGKAVTLRRWLIRVVVVLLLAPAPVVLLYAVVDPPLTPLMIIRAFEGEPFHHRSVPLERISPHLAAAALAAEDNRFCQHAGFDVQALRGEMKAWFAGDRPRGASTITMQTAKNILLWPGRDPLRKALEAWITPQIELLWSKRRIFEVYLNIAEMGHGIYGAEAAAQQHFGKSAAALNRQEAALLAAILPNPREYSASRPSAYVSRRAWRIARRATHIGPLLDCLRSPS